MAINTDIEIKAMFFERYMSIGQLKKCIEQLEDTDIVSPNRVGNLLVMRSSGQWTVGYIDFNKERFEVIE